MTFSLNNILRKNTKKSSKLRAEPSSPPPKRLFWRPRTGECSEGLSRCVLIFLQTTYSLNILYICTNDIFFKQHSPKKYKKSSKLRAEPSSPPPKRLFWRPRTGECSEGLSRCVLIFLQTTFSEKMKKIVQVEGRTIVAAAVRVSI